MLSLKPGVYIPAGTSRAANAQKPRVLSGYWIGRSKLKDLPQDGALLRLLAGGLSYSLRERLHRAAEGPRDMEAVFPQRESKEKAKCLCDVFRRTITSTTFCSLESSHKPSPFTRGNECASPVERKNVRLGAMIHACNPSTLGGRGRWIMRSRVQGQPGQHGETPSLLKIQKISWTWWRVPVIPATREAEAGELPEPRRRRLR